MSPVAPGGGDSRRADGEWSGPPPASCSEDLAWLAPSIVAGCIVYLVYLWTNPYPAHSAGLYLTMAEEVIRNDYALPRSVPYYTEGGIPFAYPPFAIYAIAIVRDVSGVGPLVASRWLPGVVVIVSLVPTYFLARELLESRRGAALVAALVAANPQLIDWHVTAGGLVRAPAFLFVLVGLYAGVRRYRSRERRWLVLTLACFALTVLTHPTYALFFAVSYLLLFVGFDRTPAGFLDGVVVGVGGLVLAAPWWATSMSVHGVDVFLGAMGTHGGIGGGVVAKLLSYSLDLSMLLPTLVVTLGVVAGLATGRTVLVAWLIAVALALGQPRFTLFVGTFLLVAVICDVGSSVRFLDRPRIRRSGPALVVVVAIVISALAGAGYVRDGTTAPGLTVTPNDVDGSDLEAMAWVRTTTHTDATFVVVGDTADWLPLFAERTVLVSPWGTEWEGPRAYERHTEIYRSASLCATERCLGTTLDRHGVGPDYVYVPKDTYHVQGTPHRGSESLIRDLERSERYELVFENRGVAIFRSVPAAVAVGPITGSG